LGSRTKRFATGAWAPNIHPDASILELFASGRLRTSEMQRVGEHLAECSVCMDVLEQLPEDPLVGALREHGERDDGSPHGSDAGAKRAERPAHAESTRTLEPVEEEKAERWGPGPMDHPRYKLKTLLGHGGMGLIYLADDWEENRAVVLKFLREDLLDRPRLVERFRREAAAAILLKHRNIVEAYNVEPFGRWPALVMEYVQGTDLARLIEKAGPVPVRVGCELVRQAAIGLQHSFEQGMVHRDIKPSNLIVSSAGTVKILDFGLAKMQSELSADAGLTSTGAMLGSVDYMAPEQIEDPRIADIRADIYSLGCTLYHLLSGAPPFQGTTFEVLEAHRSEIATPLHKRRPEVPSELAAVVARMMAKEPGRRFQSPVAVARALAPFQGGSGLERTVAWQDNAAIETEVQVSGEIHVE
jgi:serine/threonine protein kinase